VGVPVRPAGQHEQVLFWAGHHEWSGPQVRRHRTDLAPRVDHQIANHVVAPDGDEHVSVGQSDKRPVYHARLRRAPQRTAGQVEGTHGRTFRDQHAIVVHEWGYSKAWTGVSTAPRRSA